MQKKTVLLSFGGAAAAAALVTNQAIDTLTDRNPLSEFIRGDGHTYCKEGAKLATDCEVSQGVIGYHVPRMSSAMMAWSLVGRERSFSQLEHAGEIIAPQEPVSGGPN